MRGSSESSAPVSVWRTTRARARASLANAESHEYSRATSSCGSKPSSSSGDSATVKMGAAPRPCSLSIDPRCSRMTGIEPLGTRLSTTATEVPRSDAWRSSSQGTASAYRAAVVTKSHRSAAPSSWRASSRFPRTTESMSGASRRASPGGRVEEVTSCMVAWPSTALPPVARARSGRIRVGVNQRSSSGWCTRTGDRVVGRSTPGALTTAPTRELTSVDLPAPVDPPTTARRGASREARRGRM